MVTRDPRAWSVLVYYSLWVLHRIPEAKAFLVEPDPHSLDVGRRNFELNRRGGRFLQAAVGPESLPPQPFECESDGITRAVPIESLPSLLDIFGLERVDIVHADVQGAELGLLEGARDVLSEGRVRFLVVSTHHHSISGDPLTHARCLDLIRSLGAHFIAEHTVAESFSGDGLVVATFDPRDRETAVEISYAKAGDSIFGSQPREKERWSLASAVSRALRRSSGR